MSLIFFAFWKRLVELLDMSENHGKYVRIVGITKCPGPIGARHTDHFTRLRYRKGIKKLLRARKFVHGRGVSCAELLRRLKFVHGRGVWCTKLRTPEG